MEVKTGELRNQLSRYLNRVRQTGDTIVVLDRNLPVAEIRPYSGNQTDNRSDVWSRRAQMEVELNGLDEDFELPERSTHPEKKRIP